MRPVTRLHLKSRLIPVLTALFLLVELVRPSDAWLVLMAGFGLAWLLSYGWALSLLQGLRLRREMRFGWAQVGDRLEERYTLTNASSLPALWVEVIDHTTMPEYQASRVTGLGGGSQNQWTTQGVCQRRGLYILGPTTLYTADPLGIYTAEIHDPRSAHIMITPPILPLPFIQVAPGGRAGEGRPRMNAPEPTVSAASVREYTPGDSLRWVHWMTSAHRDQLFVRLFEGTPASDWWILVDLDRQVQIGEGQAATEEHSVMLAASLADRGLRLKRAVGLVASAQELVWIPPRQGQAHRWEILRALAVVKPGGLPFQELLAHLKPGFGKQASLILITPNVQPAWLETLLPLQRSGAVPTILLLDPRTFGGSGSPLPLQAQFVKLGLAHYVIPRQLLDRPEAHPGQEGRWEWRITPTGRAVAVRTPGNLKWREIA